MDADREQPYNAPILDGDTFAPSTLRVAEGVQFDVLTEADEPISRSLAAGVYPPEYGFLVELLRTIVPAGGRVLDLGAHVGSLALAAAAAGFEVIAAEASPRNAALLQASATRNGFARMRVIHAAISDRRGSLDFCAMGPYGRVLSPATSAPSVKVRAVTVDSLLAELGIDRIDFVKMDIEGSEVAAVRGMSRLLSSEAAPPVYYESNGHTLAFYGRTPQQLKTAFARLGYSNYRVEPGRLVPVTAQEFQPLILVDYLASKGRPPGLRSWRIDRPMTNDEAVECVVAMCSSAAVPERLYMARSLSQAPNTIRKHPLVQTAVATLRDDPVEPVRIAARKERRLGWTRWL
jgi:FkbM family methyltransferase